MLLISNGQGCEIELGIKFKIFESQEIIEIFFYGKLLKSKELYIFTKNKNSVLFLVEMYRKYRNIHTYPVGSK